MKVRENCGTSQQIVLAMPKTVAQEKYVAVAAKMIEKYGRKIVHST